MIAPGAGEEGKQEEAEDEGVSGEDVDVEILYMRLKALQSMKEKLDQEEDDDNENQIVEEMQELLDEADQAAEEVQPLVDIDEAGMDVFMKASMEECNGDEFSKAPDPMVDVVKRLKEAARKTKQQVQDADSAAAGDYSPTQSPIRDVGPLTDFDLDQINPQSPVELEGGVIENEDDLTEVKMEIDPLPEETEAETNFFKQQMEDPLFPASVWEFQKKEIIETTKVGNEQKGESDDIEEISGEEKKAEVATLEAYHSAVMAESKTVQKFRRKRARSRGKSQTASEQATAASMSSEPVIIPEEEPEEDENALRAAVLTSMAVKRAKKEEASLEEEKVVKTTSAEKASKPASSSLVVAKKVSPPKKLTLSEKKRLLEKRKAEVLKKAKGNKDREKLRLEIERLLGKDKKPIKNKSKVLPLIRKHFPNMFMKRVIIPAKDLLEDSSNVVTEVGPTS